MAYNPATTYVTKQDYFDFAGIDLDLELRKSNYDNQSRAVEIFIKRVENWMDDFLSTLFFNDTFDDDAFKKAVMHQIDYIRRNGDLSIQAVSQGSKLAPNAYTVLKRAGMCNLWRTDGDYFDNGSLNNG